MRWLAGILLLVLLGLQYRLWVGDGSLTDVQALRDEIVAQQEELKQLRTRNEALEAEVEDLREGMDALEERARSELGMIKQGELFLQVIEKPEPSLPEPSPRNAPSSEQTSAPERTAGAGEPARPKGTADSGREP